MKFSKQDANASRLTRQRAHSCAKTNTNLLQISFKTPKINKWEVPLKTNQQFSPYHLAFLMDEQRTKEMEIIHSNKSLTEYFQSFSRLFGTIYQASLIFTSCPFALQKQIFKLSSVKLIQFVLDSFQHQETVELMRIVTANIQQMTSSVNQFQRRIQYVLRKVCLQNQKRNIIEQAFMNQYLFDYWKEIYQKMIVTSTIDLIENQFDTAPKWLAFHDFSIFVTSHLIKEQFRKRIKQQGCLKQLDQDINLSFTIQFIIIQQLCQIYVQPAIQKQESNDCKLI